MATEIGCLGAESLKPSDKLFGRRSHSFHMPSIGILFLESSPEQTAPEGVGNLPCPIDFGDECGKLVYECKESFWCYSMCVNTAFAIFQTSPINVKEEYRRSMDGRSHNRVRSNISSTRLASTDAVQVEGHSAAIESCSSISLPTISFASCQHLELLHTNNT